MAEHRHVEVRTAGGRLIERSEPHVMAGGTMAYTQAAMRARASVVRDGGTARRVETGHWVWKNGRMQRVYRVVECADACMDTSA